MARQLSSKKPQDLRMTLADLMKYLKRHRFTLALVAILVAISSSANLFGTYMLKPIINNYIAYGNSEGLKTILLIVASIYLLGVISAFAYSQIMAKTAQSIIKEIRHDLFAHMQKLPLAYFDTNKHGDIMSHFSNDMDTLSECLNNSFSMIIKSFIEMVGTLGMLMVLNFKLSLIVLVFYILMYLYIQYSSKHSKHYFNMQMQELGELNGFIKERIAGQKVIKVFNHEKANIKAFDEQNEELCKAATSALAYSATQVPAVVSISYINYALVAVVGGLMAINGLADVGSLAAYLVFVRQSSLPINQFTAQTNFMLAALAGAERIFASINEKTEIDEGHITLKDNAWFDGKNTYPLKGDIVLDNVSFAYLQDKPVLYNLSLHASPLKKVAFVGATGAGKTTITNLLNRFYDVDEGRILFDGLDIKDIAKSSLRHNIGIVLQDTHLFSATIAENIRFAKPDAGLEEVMEAAKIANADSFIKRLPQGYDTFISADGGNLSQGQRQLLAIARAAICDTKVLILDEATSSIDTRTEKLIVEAMNKLMENKTVFIIAHRLSTVRNADMIMVLDHGRVIEKGNHQELLAQKGFYYQLYMGMFELD